MHSYAFVTSSAPLAVCGASTFSGSSVPTATKCTARSSAAGRRAHRRRDVAAGRRPAVVVAVAGSECKDSFSSESGEAASQSPEIMTKTTNATTKAITTLEQSGGALQKSQRRQTFVKLACFLAMTLASTVLRALNPALATATATATAGAAVLGPLARFSAMMESSSFLSGLTASFLLVLASEIGDKTFFISALLSMKYSRVLVLVGTMVALASMTVISVGIGQIFHALPNSLNSSIPFDDYAAVALLLWFGWQNIRDGLAMKADDDEELQDAKDVVDGREQKPQATSGFRVVAETSSLIFLAEWGDKSMLATVALAAAKSPLGVIVGGITGHFIASIIAVVGGSVLGKYISERNARLIGGVLFFVFAFLTILGIY